MEGAPKGSFALFSKTHHAAIDGTSGVEMSVATHDLSSDYKQRSAPAIVKVDHHPSRAELVLRSSLNNIKKPFHFLSVARNTVPGMAKSMLAIRRGELRKVKDIPRTRFNGKVSPHRVFDAINVSLDDIKRIKNSVQGATVNDVAISIVGGAMRKYLVDKNELPAQSTVAMTPVNVRSDKDTAGGNLVSSMTVRMRSDIESARKSGELAKIVARMRLE